MFWNELQIADQKKKIMPVFKVPSAAFKLKAIDVNWKSLAYSKSKFSLGSSLWIKFWISLYTTVFQK